MSIDYSTEDGRYYQALAVTENDHPPEGAGITHAVFGDGGYLAGYLADRYAPAVYDAHGELIGLAGDLPGALRIVGEFEAEARKRTCGDCGAGPGEQCDIACSSRWV